MTNNETNPNEQKLPFVGRGSFLKSQQNGFAFCKTEETYRSKIEGKDKSINEMEEKPSPFKTILSFICIGVAIILGYIEAQNVQMGIVGNGNFNETTAFLVGWCFASLGLICGELLSAGFKKDEFTGRRKPTGRWWVGLLLTLIYVAGQYFIASRASIGASEEMQATVDTMTMFILGISVIEVLFGALFLRNALQVFSILITNIQLKFLMGKMKRTSRRSEEWWQRYLFDVQVYNQTHDTSIAPESQTEAIKRSSEFYCSGGYLETN